MKAIYQGLPGAYSEEAAASLFGEENLTAPAATFDEVFEAVSAGSADVGVVPIENSVAGSVLENYDLLLEHDLVICAEKSVEITHCLMASKGADISKVQRVYSHPQALSQCAKYLKEQRVQVHASLNTAVAAKEVAEKGDKMSAAIASKRAAAIYGLEILSEDIQMRGDNTTRFFAIKKPSHSLEQEADKASMVFTTKNHAGALRDCLSIFHLHDLNLTKLESRPTKKERWEYYFYADFEDKEGSLLDRRTVEDLMSALSGCVEFQRLLGLYKRG